MSDLIKQQAHRIQYLEQELWIVKRQLQQLFLGQKMNGLIECRRPSMQFYEEEYEREHNIISTPRILQQDVKNDCEGIDTVDLDCDCDCVCGTELATAPGLESTSLQSTGQRANHQAQSMDPSLEGRQSPAKPRTGQPTLGVRAKSLPHLLGHNQYYSV